MKLTAALPYILPSLVALLGLGSLYMVMDHKTKQQSPSTILLPTEGSDNAHSVSTPDILAGNNDLSDTNDSSDETGSSSSSSTENSSSSSDEDSSDCGCNKQSSSSSSSNDSSSSSSDTTDAPTALPTESPSRFISDDRTDAPTALPTEAESLQPTRPCPTHSSSSSSSHHSSSHGDDQEGDEDGTDKLQRTLRRRQNISVVHCDFAHLEVGLPLADVHQADVLQSECQLSVMGTNADGQGSRPVTVVEIMNYSAVETVDGAAASIEGEQDQVPDNHSDKGLALLPERDNWLLPSDMTEEKEEGGCLYIDFVDPVILVGLELQNVSLADPTTIALIDSDGTVGALSSHSIDFPVDASDNFTIWNVTISESGLSNAADGVVLVAICSQHELILSSVQFGEDLPLSDDNDENKSNGKSGIEGGNTEQIFTRDHQDVAHEITAVSRVDDNAPSCSQHVTGFSLIDHKNGKRVALIDHMILSTDDWSKDLSLEANVEDPSSVVDSVVFLPPNSDEGEPITDAPYQFSAAWIHELHGPAKILANAYDSQADRILSSCMIHIIVESTQEQSCGPEGVTGFLLLDGSGQPMDDTRLNHLREGQIIDSSFLPDDVFLAASASDDTEAVVFEVNGSGDVYSIGGPLFRMNSHDFRTDGVHSIKARAYDSTDFFHTVNTCEISFRVLGGEPFSGDQQDGVSEESFHRPKESTSLDNSYEPNTAAEAEQLSTCDFSNFKTGISLSDRKEKDIIAQQCGLEIMGSVQDGTVSIPVIIAAPPGALSRNHHSTSCGASKGSLRGTSDISAFVETPNAKSIQFGHIVESDQSQEQLQQGDIACMHVDFLNPVRLDGLTISGVTGEEAKIIVMDTLGESTAITSPPDSKETCAWQVGDSNPELKRESVVLVTICFSIQGTLSSISYFASPLGQNGNSEFGQTLAIQQQVSATT